MSQHTRFLQFDLTRAEPDSDVIPATISSEAPVDRGGYLEILSHAPGAVDLSRAPLPLIEGHDTQPVNVGIVEGLTLAGGKLRGLVRFGASQRAQELLADVKAGIVRSLSIGYRIFKTQKSGDRLIATRWQPYEASIVAVPADASAGFYRSQSGNFIMSDENITQTQELSRSQRRALHARETEVLEATRQAELDERQRVQGIRNMCSMHKTPELEQRAIDEGWKFDELRQVILAEVERRSRSNPGTDATHLDLGGRQSVTMAGLGLSRSEQDRFSLMRAIRFLSDPAKHQREAGFEMEVSRAMEQRTGKAAQGLLLPQDAFVSRTRGLSVGNDAAGGYLVGTQHMADQFIDVVRQDSIFLPLVRVLNGLTGDVEIPKLTSGSTTYWVTEGSNVTESTPAFGSVNLHPRTVGCYTQITRRLMMQSSPQVEDLIRRDFTKSIAAELDSTLLGGVGGVEPLGIQNTTGILTTSASGAVALDELTGRIAAVGSAMGHSDPGQGLTWAIPWAAYAWFSKTPLVASTDSVMFYQNGKLAGTPCVITDRVASGTLLLGDFSQVFLSLWSGVDLNVDRATLAPSGGVRLVALQDVDIAVRYASAFGELTSCTYS